LVLGHYLVHLKGGDRPGHQKTGTGMFIPATDRCWASGGTYGE
jgi:hypothetical protein